MQSHPRRRRAVEATSGMLPPSGLAAWKQVENSKQSWVQSRLDLPGACDSGDGKGEGGLRCTEGWSVYRMARVTGYAVEFGKGEK